MNTNHPAHRRLEQIAVSVARAVVRRPFVESGRAGATACAKYRVRPGTVDLDSYQAIGSLA